VPGRLLGRNPRRSPTASAADFLESGHSGAFRVSGQLM
jgi:hypothetical protein